MVKRFDSAQCHRHENLKKYFDVRLAVVEVRSGETEEEAWRRHLEEHPEHRHVNIRIFHCPYSLVGRRQMREKSG